jgi:hypothetical protein
LRNFEHSQFFELLAQTVKYFILIPFFDAILFSRPLHDIMSNEIISALFMARLISDLSVKIVCWLNFEFGYILKTNFINAASPQFSGHISTTNFLQTMPFAFFES